MSSDPLNALEAHYRSMPPVAAMQVRIAGFDGAHLRLQAPLAIHVNDKGTAFGGSLTSLMTLAAWGLATLQVEAAGLDAEVYVADSDVRYLAPLRAALEACAELAGGDWEAFLRTLRQRGRARVSIVARVALPEGGVAARMEARYVAILRPPAAA